MNYGQRATGSDTRSKHLRISDSILGIDRCLRNFGGDICPLAFMF